MKIPFVDLKSHHAPHREEFDQAIAEVIDAGAFAGGPFVAEFERDFARYCECKYAAGLGSGTEALWLALLALDVGPGDEVITVPSTFMATAEAITYAGATPVFVDVDEQTYTMNPAQLKAAFTDRTKALMPVHLFGQSADMDPILEFARENEVPVIEDASQAHGALYKGRKVGSLGDIGCFSFYPGKNLGAFGEAGASVTNNPELDRKIRVLREHGQTSKYYHSMIGWNCRMDGIQAAVLRIKLRHLERGNQARRSHAARYNRAFEGTDGIIAPHAAGFAQHVYHIYAIRVQERDELLQHLEREGIGCGVHYPVPIHLQDAYASLGHQRGSFPVSEATSAEFISLPMFPELTSAQIDAVAATVKEAIPETVWS